MSPEALWDELVAPRLDEYVAGVYEEACRQFVARAAHPSLPFRPHHVGSWWNHDSSEEADVVALGPDGRLLVGECKWGTVGSRDLDKLARRAEIIAREAKAEEVTLALFSGRGLERGELGARIEAGEALHFALEELY